jgi:hypothetical protein
MSRPHRRRAERSAGAFLSPIGPIPVPMRTIGDDLNDDAMEPEDDREPELTPPGVLPRAIGRLPPPWRARWLAVEAHSGWVVGVGALGLFVVVLILRASIPE